MRFAVPWAVGGGLAKVRPDDLLAAVFRVTRERHPRLGERSTGVRGNANGAGEDNRNVARMAVLLSGLPVNVPAHCRRRRIDVALSVRHSCA